MIWCWIWAGSHAMIYRSDFESICEKKKHSKPQKQHFASEHGLHFQYWAKRAAGEHASSWQSISFRLPFARGFSPNPLNGELAHKRRLKRTLKSSRACAPRLSLRASALYIVCLQLIRRFCSSSASTRSEFQTMPRSYSCKKTKKFNPWQD